MTFSFLAAIINVVALVSGLTGGLMGYGNTREKIEDAACEIESLLQTTLRNVYQELALFWQKMESDIIPEANHTMLAARESMTELIHIVTDTSIVAQETIQESFGVRYLFMNRTSVFTESVDNVLIQLRFEVEIGLIMLYLFINMLCGHELGRIANIQRPSAYKLLERDMVRLLRVACKLSCLFHVLYITGRLFYFLILSRSQARPNEILPCIILPIIIVIAINLGRLLKSVLSSFVFSFIAYILWIPINLVLLPVLMLLYIVSLQPTVWLVRVYENRRQYRNQFGIYVIRLLIVIIPVLVILTFEVITTHICDTINLGTGFLLAMLIAYILYYITACTIIVNYHPNSGTKSDKCLSHDFKFSCPVCTDDPSVSS